jgi:hypothetical protein
MKKKLFALFTALACLAATQLQAQNAAAITEEATCMKEKKCEAKKDACAKTECATAEKKAECKKGCAADGKKSACDKNLE